MKIYAVYENGKRVKQIRAKFTKEKVMAAWYEWKYGPKLFDYDVVAYLMQKAGLSIQVMGETE